jgi:hypothetical protein
MPELQIKFFHYGLMDACFFMWDTRALVRLATFKESGFKMLLQGGEVVNEGMGLSAHAEGSSQNSQLPRGLERRAVNALNKFGQTAKYNLDTYRPAPVMPGKISFDTLLGKKNHG